ncbi:MAG: alkaline phosphatase D family protein, partial [Nitrospirales bacterium]
PADPFRLYRSFRYGADLELFILDTRQYRDRNGDADGPGKTMLGLAQREWLVEGLSRSTATWKVVASSVPLSLSQPGSPSVPGNDSWARSADGTGFFQEMSFILGRAADRSVRNLVWLVGDVHFAQVNAYDPDHDDVPDFYEFISGPLSAVSVKPRPPQTDLSPTTFYSAGGFPNFGVVEIDGTTLRVTKGPERSGPFHQELSSTVALCKVCCLSPSRRGACGCSGRTHTSGHPRNLPTIPLSVA